MAPEESKPNPIVVKQATLKRDALLATFLNPGQDDDIEDRIIDFEDTCARLLDLCSLLPRDEQGAILMPPRLSLCLALAQIAEAWKHADESSRSRLSQALWDLSNQQLLQQHAERLSAGN